MNQRQDMGAMMFDLKTSYLKQGRKDIGLASTGLLSIVEKLYAAGGENTMHAHPEEDHCFVVLEGEATFHIGSEENVQTVSRYQGIMLPKGTFYRFLSSADSNLVMLRVGAVLPGSTNHAIHADGIVKTAHTDPIAATATQELPGPGFGA